MATLTLPKKLRFSDRLAAKAEAKWLATDNPLEDKDIQTPTTKRKYRKWRNRKSVKRWSKNEIRLLCGARSLDWKFRKLASALSTHFDRALSKSLYSSKICKLKLSNDPIYLEYLGPDRKSHVVIEGELLRYQQELPNEVELHQQAQAANAANNEQAADGDGDVQMGGMEGEEESEDEDEVILDANGIPIGHMGEDKGDMMEESSDDIESESESESEYEKPLPPGLPYGMRRTSKGYAQQIAAMGHSVILENGEAVALEKLHMYLPQMDDSDPDALLDPFEWIASNVLELEDEPSQATKDLQNVGGTNLWHDMQPDHKY